MSSRRSWYNNQRSEDYSPATMAPAAVAGYIAPAHDGVADANIAPAIPKYNQIVPQSVPVNACWNGSQIQVDVIVDKSIGKALNYFVQFDVQYKNTGTASGDAYLASAASLIDHYDILHNGSVIETVYGPNLFMEGMVMSTNQKLAQNSKVWGIDITTNSSGYAQPSMQTVAAPVSPATVASSSTITYYVPLVGVVPSAELFVAGIKGELRFRFYLEANPLCKENGFVTPATMAISLQNMYLWVEEASVSEETFSALMKQSKSGLNYRSTIRTLWQKTQPGLSANTPQTDILNAFSNDSAGLLVWLSNTSLDNGWFMNRIPLSTLQLLDAGGATLTRQLNAPLVNNVITPSQVPVASNFLNNPNFSMYLFPFSSSLYRVLNGKTLGGLHLSAQEQLQIQVPTAPGSAVLENVISFDYAALRVQNGELKWARTAGDVPAW
jgi:hypothetical protein